MIVLDLSSLGLPPVKVEVEVSDTEVKIGAVTNYAETQELGARLGSIPARPLLRKPARSGR